MKKKYEGDQPTTNDPNVYTSKEWQRIAPTMLIGNRLNRCLIHCQHTFCGTVLVFPFVPWATLESFSRRQRVSTKHPRCTRPSPVSVPCPSASFHSITCPATHFFFFYAFTSFRPFPETYPVNIVFYSLSLFNSTATTTHTFTMPGKFDPTEEKIIMMRAIGGEMGAAASLAPKVGPLGLSPKKVGEDIMKCSKDWMGLKVTVKLTVVNRKATAEVVPSAAALIIRFLKEPVKSRKDKAGGETIHDGNITFDNVLEVSRAMRARSMAKEFKGTVKEILGTCYSVGCTVDDQHPSELQQQIDDGELDCPEE
jgi:large subunit ribosomal protein L12e